MVYEELESSEGRLVSHMAEFVHVWFMKRYKPHERDTIRDRFYRGVDAWKADSEVKVFAQTLRDDIPLETVALVCCFLRATLNSFQLPSVADDNCIELDLSQLLRTLQSLETCMDTKLIAAVKLRWQHDAAASESNDLHNTLELWRAVDSLVEVSERHNGHSIIYNNYYYYIWNATSSGRP